MKWPEVPLGEVCELKYGKSLPDSSRIPGPFPVYGSNGIVGSHSQAITRGPSIVVGRKGSIGAISYSANPCWPIDTTYYVDSSAITVDLKWLYYVLLSLRLEKLNRAAAVPGLNREDAYRKRISLPPLDEQKRIAAILDHADALRAKRRAALAKLDSLKQSIFLDMFGDPVTNPKGWLQKTLNAACEGIYDCPHSTPKWSEHGVICLRTSNLTTGGWDWTDTRFVTKEMYRNRSARAFIAEGDLILSREGTVGIAAIVPKGLQACMGQRLVQLRPNRREITPNVLLRVILCLLDPRRLGNSLAGSTSRHLNVKELKNFRIFLPPLKLQNEFDCLADKVDTGMGYSNNASLLSNSLITSLQHRAFRGEL